MLTSLQSLAADPVTSFVVSVAGVLVGALITWLVSRHYYKRAGDELREEAALLHKSTNAIVYILQHPEAEIEVKRDSSGRLNALVVSSTARAAGTSEVIGVGADGSQS